MGFRYKRKADPNNFFGKYKDTHSCLVSSIPKLKKLIQSFNGRVKDSESESTRYYRQYSTQCIALHSGKEKAPKKVASILYPNPTLHNKTLNSKSLVLSKLQYISHWQKMGSVVKHSRDKMERL